MKNTIEQTGFTSKFKLVMVMLVSLCFLATMSFSGTAEAGWKKKIRKKARKSASHSVRVVASTANSALDEAVNGLQTVGNYTQMALEEAAPIIDLSPVEISTDMSFNDLLDTAIEIQNYQNMAWEYTPLGYAPPNPIEASVAFYKAAKTGNMSHINQYMADELYALADASGLETDGLEMTDFKRFGQNIADGNIKAAITPLTDTALAELKERYAALRAQFSSCIATATGIAGGPNSTDAIKCVGVMEDELLAMIEGVKMAAKLTRYLNKFSSGNGLDEVLDWTTHLNTYAGVYMDQIRSLPGIKLNFDGDETIEGDHEYLANLFSNYDSLEALRLASLNGDITEIKESWNKNYVGNLSNACGKLALPVICDIADGEKFTSLNDLTGYNTNEWNGGASQWHGQTIFQDLVKHAFTQEFVDQLDGNYQELNDTLFNPIINSSGRDLRLPIFVDSQYLQGGNGAFVTDGTDAVILLNEDLFIRDDATLTDQNLGNDDIWIMEAAQKVYIEELAELLKWQYCQDNGIIDCEVVGDAGARFADAAVILDDHTWSGAYETALADLTDHSYSLTKTSKLSNNNEVKIYTFPSPAVIQTYLQDNAHITLSTTIAFNVGFSNLASVTSNTMALSFEYVWPRITKDVSVIFSDDSIDCDGGNTCRVLEGYLTIGLEDGAFLNFQNKKIDIIDKFSLLSGLSRSHSITMPLIYPAKYAWSKAEADRNIMKKYATFSYAQNIIPVAKVSWMESDWDDESTSNLGKIFKGYEGLADLEIGFALGNSVSASWPARARGQIGAAYGFGAVGFVGGCGGSVVISRLNHSLGLSGHLTGCQAGSQMGMSTGIFISASHQNKATITDDSWFSVEMALSYPFMPKFVESVTLPAGIALEAAIGASINIGVDIYSHTFQAAKRGNYLFD